MPHVLPAAVDLNIVIRWRAGQLDGGVFHEAGQPEADQLGKVP